jgi:hypothetical protein
MKIQDQCSKVAINQSHESVPDDLLKIESSKLDVITEAILKKHLEHVEIICVVEGVDPVTSGTFQALQSYTLENIAFSGAFKRCIRVDGDRFVVDLDAFHRIMPGE